MSVIHTLLVAQVQCAENADQVAESLGKLQSSLLHKNMVSLHYVCQSLCCIPEKRTRLYKIDYAKVLVQWVGNQFIHVYCH